MSTLQQHLAQLESGGLVRLAQVHPEVEYLFRHALLQEVAYQSLLKEEKRKLHAAIGQVVEGLYADRLASRELAPLLANHFAVAGDEARALKYYTLAGDASAKGYANVEACMHYTRAVEIARRLETTSTQRLPAQTILHLYTSLGQAQELNGQYTGALELYTDLESQADQRGDPSLKFAAVMARAKILSTPNLAYDPAQARRLLEQALAVARDLGDRANEARVLWNMMLLDTFAGGDLYRAIERGEQALAIARELDMREQLAFTLNDIQYAFNATGQHERARQALAEARDLWRALGNLPMLADNLANTALHQVNQGRFRLGIEQADEAYRISQSIDNTFGQANSRFVLGYAYILLGQFGQAAETTQAALRYGEQVGHPPALIIARSDRAWLYASLGMFERAIELANESLANSDRYYPMWRPQPLGVLARLHARTGSLAAAQACFEEARQALRPAGLQLFGQAWVGLAECEVALAGRDPAQALSASERLLAYLTEAALRQFVPDALSLQARALLDLGRTDDARAAYERARAEAEAMEARFYLWSILAALGEMEAQAGNDPAAARFRQQARAHVNAIAAACPPDLRAAFLGLPDVRLLLESEPDEAPPAAR